jgi:hypothetical protein
LPASRPDPEGWLEDRPDNELILLKKKTRKQHVGAGGATEKDTSGDAKIGRRNRGVFELVALCHKFAHEWVT